MLSTSTISRVASAVAMSAFFLTAPMAQATDRYPEKNGVIGGSLYVADPSQSVVVTLGLDDDLFHPKHKFYWKDGVEGEWKLLYDDKKFQSVKKLTDEQKTFTLNPTQSDIYFAIDLTHYGKTYLFSTGDGSLNAFPAGVTKYDVTATHAAVIYDHQEPGRVWVGFEDTPKFVLSDWDDFTFFATNLRRDPPPAVPEPEAYAMLLAGLGIVGFVAKRRRRA
jgi:hypothetical protein